VDFTFYIIQAIYRYKLASLAVIVFALNITSNNSSIIRVYFSYQGKCFNCNNRDNITWYAMIQLSLHKISLKRMDNALIYTHMQKKNGPL